MRFFNLDHSPYAARVRILIMLKNVPIEIVEPPIAIKTAEFLEKYPLGKIPLLELNNGDYLPESVPIMEYIEDQFPARSCRPNDPLLRAQMRVLVSYTDTHLGPALLPFFKALLIADFEFDKKAQFEVLVVTLEKLNRWLKAHHSSSGSFYKASLDLGDMVLAPTLWYVNSTVPLFCNGEGKGNAMDGLTYVQQWCQWVNQNEHVDHAITSMETAFNAFLNAK